MRPGEIQNALERAERSLEAGGPLAGTGFWKAVDALRTDRVTAARYKDRVAAIDRRAFERGVKLRVPVWAGNLVLGSGTIAGAVAVFLGAGLGGLTGSLLFLGGFGALILATHSLSHYLVGRAVGIRFTHYFIGGPPPPRPGAKIDYASYLAVEPVKRAVMHASGAVVTKLVPFALIPIALAASLEWWAIAALVVVGIAQLFTDALLSVKISDWKKVRRELAAARAPSSQPPGSESKSGIPSNGVDGSP